MGDFTDAVEGFDLADAVGRSWQAGQSAGTPVSSVTGFVTSELRQVRPLTGHELTFLKSNSPLPIRMTLLSATQFPAIFFKRGVTDKFYKDLSALLCSWQFSTARHIESRTLSEGENLPGRQTGPEKPPIPPSARCCELHRYPGETFQGSRFLSPTRYFSHFWCFASLPCPLSQLASLFRALNLVDPGISIVQALVGLQVCGSQS
jgi:hypothetical protein